MKGAVVWCVDKSDFLSDWMSQVKVGFWYSNRIHVAATAPCDPKELQKLVDELLDQMVGEMDPNCMQVNHNHMGSVLYFASKEDATMFYLIMKEWQE